MIKLKELKIKWLDGLNLQTIKLTALSDKGLIVVKNGKQYVITVEDKEKVEVTRVGDDIEVTEKATEKVIVFKDYFLVNKSEILSIITIVDKTDDTLYYVADNELGALFTTFFSYGVTSEWWHGLSGVAGATVGIAGIASGGGGDDEGNEVTPPTNTDGADDVDVDAGTTIVATPTPGVPPTENDENSDDDTTEFVTHDYDENCGVQRGEVDTSAFFHTSFLYPWDLNGTEYDGIKDGEYFKVMLGDNERDVLKNENSDMDAYMVGFKGRDFIKGGDGNDRLYGKEGVDSMDGGSGDDLLVGGSGDDSLYGRGGMIY